MTAEVCSHCRGPLSPGAHSCPSCGYFASPEPANWLDRLSAATIDISIWAASSAFLIWLGLKWWMIFPVWIALTEVGFQLKGSIGKSFIGLTGPVKGRAQHYLRETIGRLASAATFGIGFALLFSKERLALHDYMAKTNVVRTGNLSRTRHAIVSLFALFVLAVCAYFVFRSDGINQTVPSKQSSSLTSIVSQMPAVVTMYVYDSRHKPIGQGSGFIISEDGVGVTNFHVIKDAYSADVKLGDARLYHLLTVRAYDSEHDIAVFQIGRKTRDGIEVASNLPFLSFATQDAQTGDRIATVGSPEGLTNSVADGLVSAVRTNEGSRLLQISAPISPGSSGGPVFNLKGEVVGISSFQFVEGQNLNFAIPIDEVSKILERRVDLSLEQLYRRSHFSPATRSIPDSDLASAEPTITGSATPKHLTGSFLGAVHNLTSDVTANFGIFIVEDRGVIAGCMAVRQPLSGSGPLTGSITGRNVQFDVDNSDFSIRFTGHREKNKLSGTYHVFHQNGDSEEGEFLLKRKDYDTLPEDFDPRQDCPRDTGVKE